MSETAVVLRDAGAVCSITDLEKMAHYMVASKLFGIQSKEQAVALMLISQAEGLHPAIAARDYHIIQGRHTLKADALLARFQQTGGKVEWLEYTDEKVSAIFSHPQSPRPVMVDWDMDRAKVAGLGDKDNWKKYRRQMLKARVVSDGVRLCSPGCAVGVYTPEEVLDFEPASTEWKSPQSSKPTVTPPQAKPIANADAEPPADWQPEFAPPMDDTRPEPQAEPVNCITEKQRKLVWAKSKNKGISSDELHAYLDRCHSVAKVDHIPYERLNQVLEWIDLHNSEAANG